MWGIFRRTRDRSESVTSPARPDGSAADTRRADEHNAVGIALQQAGDRQGARASFEQALQLDPRSWQAHNNLATSYFEEGDLGEAELHYREAVALEPGHPAVGLNLGIVLRRLGRLDEAGKCFADVVARYPRNADGWNNLAAIHFATGRLSDAEACLRRAVECNSALPEAHRNLGQVAAALGRSDEAAAHYRKALELQPNSVDTLIGLADVVKVTDLDAAEAHCRSAIAIAPAQASAHVVLGTILRARGDYQGAEHCYRHALALDANSAEASFSLANIRLLEDDYAEGFRLYESRFSISKAKFRLESSFERSLGVERRWRGPSLTGMRIVVWTEQGYGDTLMMLRYLRLLRQRGAAEIVVVCPPPLSRLIEYMPEVTRAVSGGRDIARNEFDLQCPVMSLPFACGTTFASVPIEVPYLAAPPHEVVEWGSRLCPIGDLKVGLCWAGSKSLQADAARSIPFDRLAPLLSTPGVQFVNLQKEDRGDNARALSELLNLVAMCGDFLDTAALIQNLDLVITADTAVAHLAGALGRRVWLLNRFESEWRWGLGRNHSPWYPTMRIFRQPEPGAWGQVIETVAAELASLSSDAHAPRLVSHASQPN